MIGPNARAWLHATLGNLGGGGLGYIEPGALALWQAQCSGTVEARALPAGHFIPEELHQQTAQALRGFFR